MDDLEATRLIGSGVRKVVKKASRTASEKGFWDDYGHVDERFAECIALCHTELSEALEAHRKGNYHGKDGVQEELADTVIRIFDLADKVDGDVPGGQSFTDQLIEKMEENEGRDYKHGKRY